MPDVGISWKAVRINGLEPLRLSPLDPKSSAATNYAISAFSSAAKAGAKVHLFFQILALFVFLQAIIITV